MKVRALILLILLGIFLAFMMLNWSTIMAPTSLDLGVAEVHAPLGLVMLGMLALLTAFFLIFTVYLQTSVLLEARRHAKELQTNRELADKAEASRFTELRNFLDIEIQKQVNSDAALKTDMLARLDILNTDLNAAIEQSASSLSAYIGELEDRLETKFPAPNK